ncbi:hypothetical protein SAMN04488595_103247 [Ralstonia sp. 25mfcol4.1]|uniref:hypothetical protein n=1 Tax=Burkholderiaceae TaxID=119060 RepID=UPI0003FE2C8E|nr:hypothetical protein [Ralstonia sp. 25mfcol4.1]SDO96073.1 hypothetical protein SAMN04488595_103247 [Ralstonia sp. 25mfcol4.1]
MASMPFEEGSGRAQPGATMVAGYPVGRWTRYADMAAVAGLGLGLLAALFGILDYQRNVYGDMLKTEVRAVVSTMSEMDRRLSGEIGALDKKLSGQIVALDKKLSGQIVALDNRLSGQIGALDNRLSGGMKGLEARLGDKIDATNRRLDETNQRLVGLEKEVGGINVRLGRLEGKVAK